MKHELTILTAELAIGDYPTDRALRIAKAMGFAAVLHHQPDPGRPDPVEGDGLRRRVEAARLVYGSIAFTPSRLEALPTSEHVVDTISGLPGPVLIVGRDRASIEMLAGILLNLPQRAADTPGGPTDSVRPGADPHKKSRAA